MLKDKKRTGKQLPIINRQKDNGTVHGTNIFKLTDGLKSEMASVTYFKNSATDIDFTTNLLVFAKQVLPDELKKLSYDPVVDGLDNLTADLVNIIVAKNYDIVYTDYEETKSLEILFSIPFNWCWYIVEGVYIDAMPCEALKIGYAYLLNKISKSAYHSALQQWNFTEDEDSHFQMECDMVREGAYNGEFSDVADDQMEKAEAYIEASMSNCRHYKALFDEYWVKDIANFYDYVPQDSIEIDLKKLILEGLDQIDFQVFYKFSDDEEFEEYGYASYSQSLTVLFDYNDGLEREFMDNVMEQAGNAGTTFPMGLYTIKNGKCIMQTSIDDIEMLGKACAWLHEFLEYLNQKLVCTEKK